MAGTYDVKLIAINALGQDTVEMLDYITIQENPVPGFDYVATELMVDFTDDSSFGNTYSWDFGDGNSSSETNPTHTYSGQGDYDVTLLWRTNVGWK